MAGDENMRIGDAEREAAVARLQNHMADGRLTPDEFNERMDRAFEAKTAAEITTLFSDLPGSGASPYEDPYGGTASYGPPQPYSDDPYGMVESPYAQSPAPSSWGGDSQELQPAESPRPWFAQWWILLIAIFVTGGANGRLWFLVPMAAIWIWVIWPSLDRQRRARLPQAPAAPPRPLTFQERDEVIRTLHSSGEISAIKRYRELTGADLYTATMTVRAINRELGGG